MAGSLFFRIICCTGCWSFWLLLPAGLWACECDQSIRIEAALDSATSVFIGKVTDIQDSRTYFRVEKVLKGDKNALVLTAHRDELKKCDFDFRSGEEYFVFADGPLERLTVSKCSPTSVWGQERFFAAEKGSGLTLTVYQIGIFGALILAGILLYSNILPRKNKKNL